MSIDGALKKLRAERGWTQGEIFRRTGLERSYLSRLEAGKVKDLSVRTAMKLASAFGLSVEEFWLICQDHDGSPQGKGKGANSERSE
jgi:putative transcriptional regulator